MDCAPLNLAHFHERRADKFLRNNRYEDAYAALQTSLFYLQDALKNVRIPKSIEIINTQKWDYERKLRQIQIRKQQHERPKLRDLISIAEMNNVPLSNVTAQSVAKSIDKTIKDFDAKYNSTYVESNPTSSRKENQEPTSANTKGSYKGKMSRNNSGRLQKRSKVNSNEDNDNDDVEDGYEGMPTLAPLELPAFDFNVFTTSTPGLSNIAGLDDVFGNVE